MSVATAAGELIRRYWECCEGRDWDAFGALLADDVVYRLPQTREVVYGRADYVEFNRTFPGDWHVRIDRIVGQPGSAVSWTTFTVDGVAMTGLCFFTITDGLVAEIDDFWPEPSDAPVCATDVVRRY